jgi:hypothetical protein
MKKIATRNFSAFLLLCCLTQFCMPVRALADSFTFSVDGSPQEPLGGFQLSAGLGPQSSNLLTISFALGDSGAQALANELTVGSQFQSVSIDAFSVVSGVATLVATSEFDGDVVASATLGIQGGAPLQNVTFAYQSETTTIVDGATGSSPTPSPEPSTLLLLGTGVLGALVLFRPR